MKTSVLGALASVNSESTKYFMTAEDLSGNNAQLVTFPNTSSMHLSIESEIPILCKEIHHILSQTLCSERISLSILPTNILYNLTLSTTHLKLKTLGQIF